MPGMLRVNVTSASATAMPSGSVTVTDSVTGSGSSLPLDPVVGRGRATLPACRSHAGRVRVVSVSLPAGSVPVIVDLVDAGSSARLSLNVPSAPAVPGDRRPVRRVARQQRRPGLGLALDLDGLAVDDAVVLGRGDGDLRRRRVEHVANGRRRIGFAARPDDRDREVVDALRQLDRDDRPAARRRSATSAIGGRCLVGRASGRSWIRWSRRPPASPAGRSRRGRPCRSPMYGSSGWASDGESATTRSSPWATASR